jgi:hypothetical protein
MQTLEVNKWQDVPNNYTGIAKSSDDSKYWYLNGKWHRIDGPAVEDADGTKVWYLNGKLHREDGPAIEWANGSREWWLNGKRHREDGPAVELANGAKAWYLNGKKYYPKSDDTIRNINQLLDTIGGEPNIDVKTVKIIRGSLLVFNSKVIISSGGYGFDLTIDSQENIYVDGEQVTSPPLTEDTIDELVSIIMKRGQETTHKRFEKQAEDPFMKESFSLAKILFNN